MSTFNNNVRLYEDEHILVIGNLTASPVTLVTFGDAATLVNGDSFVADQVAVPLGYNCVGIMPKTTHWYPKDSMDAGSKAIKSALAATRAHATHIITHGASMGGYAALKYSRLLGATDVLAYCPQWSLCPTECGGNKSGYSSSFRPHMVGMGVKSSDLIDEPHRVRVVYDPWHSVDSFHAGKLKEQLPYLTEIRCRSTGHFIPKILLGKDFFRSVIESIRVENPTSLRAAISGKVRKSRYRQFYTFRRTVERHPRWAARLLLKNHAEFVFGDAPSDALDFESLVPTLLTSLHASGATAETKKIARLKALRDHVHEKADRIISNLNHAALVTQEYGLATAAGKTLVLDRNKAQFVAVDYEQILRSANRYSKVHLSGLGQNYLLTVTDSDDSRFVCLIEEQGNIKLMSFEYAQIVSVTCYEVKLVGERATIQLTPSKFFCSATPGGVISFNKPWARSCEHFTLL